MTPRWQRTTITLACVRGNEPVEADVLGALAVHRTVFMPWVHARWSVTHVPTGRHVATANTKRLARRFVREVTPLVDWAASTTLRGCPDEIRTAISEAMLRAHNGRYVSEVRLR